MQIAPSVKDYRLWRVIENNYPYDVIVDVHHMLIPRRQFAHEWDMLEAEREELEWIKSRDLMQYDVIMLNLPHNRTVPGWLHYHLCTYKELAPDQT